MDISIHALRGEDDLTIKLSTRIDTISIHALRGEDDASCAHNLTNNKSFQSTPSVGRTTLTTVTPKKKQQFQSTPSVGRTTFNFLFKKPNIYHFNPRPPWGGRHFSTLLYKEIQRFQSTPSVGRTTPSTRYMTETVIISIHALRGEDDSKNIQICNIVFVHSAYKIIYFCDSCAFYLT